MFHGKNRIFKFVRSTITVGAGLLGLIVMVIPSVQPARGAEFFGLSGPEGGDTDAMALGPKPQDWSG